MHVVGELADVREGPRVAGGEGGREADGVPAEVLPTLGQRVVRCLKRLRLSILAKYPASLLSLLNAALFDQMLLKMLHKMHGKVHAFITSL